MVDLLLSEPAGSGSLHRLVRFPDGRQFHRLSQATES
jgi:hypothetical protein